MFKRLEHGEWQRDHDLNDPFIPQPYLQRLLIIKVFQTWGGFSVGISVSESSTKATFYWVLGCKGYHPEWHTCYGRTLLLIYSQLRMCFRIHQQLKPLVSDVKPYLFWPSSPLFLLSEQSCTMPSTHQIRWVLFFASVDVMVNWVASHRKKKDDDRRGQDIPEDDFKLQCWHLIC